MSENVTQITVDAMYNLRHDFDVDAVLEAYSFSLAATERLQEIIDRTSPDWFTRWDVLEARDAWKHEMLMEGLR